MRQNLIPLHTHSGGQTASNLLSPDLQRNNRYIVIGLGNPILGDDGFGWVVAEQVRKSIDQQYFPVDVECFALGGLSLMERLIGYDHAIIIDAIHIGGAPAGTMHTLSLEDIPDNMAGHLSSSHDTTLKTAISMGKSLGAHLPECITIIGVETSNTFEFSEELSAPVETAVPVAIEMVLKLLEF